MAFCRTAMKMAASAFRAGFRTLVMTGKRRPRRRRMMPMGTRRSMRVKAGRSAIVQQRGLNGGDLRSACGVSGGAGVGGRGMESSSGFCDGEGRGLLLPAGAGDGRDQRDHGGEEGDDDEADDEAEDDDHDGFENADEG